VILDSIITRRYSIVGVAVLAAASALLQAQNTVEKVLIGETKVTVLNSYNGPHDLPKPERVVVYEFDLPTDVVTLDRSAAERILSHDPIAHMKGDVGRNDSALAVTAHVQVAFSNALVEELSKTSAPTETAPVTGGGDPPVNALTVHGDFTSVNLGNKTGRMLIGFGRGASDVKAHAVVSLITKDGPLVLSVFDLNSKSSKKPGAAATMGVGSAAASVGTSAAFDGKATVEADSARMAKAVAKQIQNIMIAQQWIASAPR
jgi:uncharacterized protein DUF4410